jgi:hypothetical protein
MRPLTELSGDAAHAAGFHTGMTHLNRQITDEQIWAMPSTERKTLIERLRKRYARQLASEGRDPLVACNICLL